MCDAVLWLLLMSGSALKWAGLSGNAQHLFAVAQVGLSSGVVAAGALAIVFSTAWGSAHCTVSPNLPPFDSSPLPYSCAPCAPSTHLQEIWMQILEACVQGLVSKQGWRTEIFSYDDHRADCPE